MTNYPASPESQDRTKARRFTGEPVTAFGSLHPIFAGIAAQMGLASSITREELDDYANGLRTEPEDDDVLAADEPRSIAELAEDHLYQRQEMEDADERAGLE